MSRTTINLREAFAGESQANRKYLVYAEKAERDGFPNVAKLFRAIADAETVHATRHWRALGMARDTIKNLEDSIESEKEEIEKIYPAFVKQAEADEEITARSSFKEALEAEKVHAELFDQALETVRKGKDMAGFKAFTCTVCGNTRMGVSIDRCRICGAGSGAFKEVD